MKSTQTTFFCDKCNCRLKTYGNNLNICSELKDSSSPHWSRLHVKIEHRHGMHNDGTTKDAELCQSCAIQLLEDALNRVKSGERATKGTQGSEQGSWR